MMDSTFFAKVRYDGSRIITNSLHFYCLHALRIVTEYLSVKANLPSSREIEYASQRGVAEYTSESSPANGIMPPTPLTATNLARHDEAIRPNKSRAPQSRQTLMEFDLTAIGSHLETQYLVSAKGTQSSMIEKDLNKIHMTEQARDNNGSVLHVKAASGLNARIVSWQFNVDDAPVGWRLL